MPGYWRAHSDRDYEDRNYEPPVEVEPELYECDCCGRMVTGEQIANVIAYGIETAACDRCRGVEEE